MHRAQRQVREFHERVLGEAPVERPTLRDHDVRVLRARLILEEAIETVGALVGGESADELVREAQRRVLRDRAEARVDLAAAVDGLCDLAYVAYGTAEALGVDLEPYFDEVHAANMRKVKTGEDVGGVPGKGGSKPAGWRPPRIREMLDRAARGEFAEIPDAAAKEFARAARDFVESIDPRETGED